MGLTGLKRQARSVALGAASFGMLVTGVVATAPSAVAQDAEAWTMPYVMRAGLGPAIDSVLASAGEGNVKFNYYDAVNNQVVYNFPAWVVCGQAPGSGTSVEIGSQPQRVTLALKRRSAGC